MAKLPGKKIIERVKQLVQAFKGTRDLDPRMVPIVAGVAGATLLVVGGLGVWFVGPVLGPIFGVLFALLAGMIIFGRRSQSAAIGSIEGRPGAAAAVLETMRGPWMVTPAVAVTRKQDFVHRVVGRCGVVLVGEGAPARVSSLLKQEARKVARATGNDVPVHEVSVGERGGQVPLGKLQAHVSKLPRKLKARQVGPLDRRLGALAGTDLPLPKGPMPRVHRPKKMR